MNHSFLNTIVIPLILIAIIFLIAHRILKVTEAIKLERRFEPFSLLPNSIVVPSIFDQIATKLWQIVHGLSKFLAHINIINKISKKYEKYISFEDKDYKKGIDYISIKLLLGLILVISSLIANIFWKTKTNIIVYLLFFIIGFILPDIFLNLRFHKKQKQIEEDLFKAIILMNNSFKSGSSITQAINLVRNELEGPIADEFSKIYLDISYGLSMDVVFNRFYERVKLEDAQYIATSLTILNKTGGNIIRVFANIEKAILERKRLRHELYSLAAASIFMFRLLLVLPLIFGIILYILNPTYFLPFFTTKIGIMIFILIVLLYITYILIINKVLKVKMP